MSKGTFHNSGDKMNGQRDIFTRKKKDLHNSSLTNIPHLNSLFNFPNFSAGTQRTPFLKGITK